MASKILFSLTLFFIGLTVYGQSNHFPTTGNVGVGTGTSPAYPFHVLAEMNVKLLEKVEELVLHTLSQEGKIQAQEELILQQVKRIENLETRY